MDTTIAGDIVERATQIAVEAHKDQRRKDNGTPYVAHTLSVARMLDAYGFSDEFIAAAIVHDTLEDTDVTEETLQAELGNEVASIVLAVTEDKTLDWEVRKEKYVESVCTRGEEAMAVSVADKIHNGESLIRGYERLGSAVWEKFNRGKDKKLWFEQMLLTQIKLKWDHPLLERYEELLFRMEKLDA